MLSLTFDGVDGVLFALPLVLVLLSFAAFVLEAAFLPAVDEAEILDWLVFAAADFGAAPDLDTEAVLDLALTDFDSVFFAAALLGVALVADFDEDLATVLPFFLRRGVS